MAIRSLARMSGLLFVVAAVGCAENTYKTTELSNVFEVSPAYVGVDEGTPVQFEATVDGTAVPVTWESSDVTKATVDASGLVTTVSAGFAAITATQTANTAKKKSASLTIAALIQLTSGVPLTGLSDNGARGHQIKYRITVPAGKTNLHITFTGGTGDGDVYVVLGSDPTNILDSSGAGGNAETMDVPNPVAGNYYIIVEVWDPYAGATLTATYTP